MDGKPHIRRTAIAPFLSLSLSLFLSPFLTATSIADTTYRWTDDNGNPVLSDRPPAAGTPYTEVGVNTGLRRYPKPTSIDEEKTSDAAPTSVPANAMRDASEGNANSLQVVQAEPALCEQARDNIFKLETFAQMRVQDSDGTVRFMTDEERSEQLATAYRVRDANCTSD